MKEQIRMKYINAIEILPESLIKEIQKYIAGEILYIPQPEGLKNSWGSKSGTKQEIINRNKQNLCKFSELQRFCA